MKRVLLAVILLVSVIVLTWLFLEYRTGTPSTATPDARSVANGAHPGDGLTDPQNVAEAAARAEVNPVVEDAQPKTNSGTALLRVRVVSSEDNSPLGGVAVKARPRDEKDWTFESVDRSHGTSHERPSTASDGFAEIEVPSGTILSVVVGDLHAGVSPKFLDILPIPEGETRTLAFVVSIGSEVEFHARVVDAQTRAPIAGVKVTNRNGTILDAVHGAPQSDTDGRFLMRVRGWYSALLTLDADGYAPAWALASSGHATLATEFEIMLARPAALRVHLLEMSGKAIEGVEVTAKFPRNQVLQPRDPALSNPISSEYENFSASTDANGTAVLARLPPQAGLRLTAVRNKETLREENAPLVLLPGEERELTWRIGAGCRIFGVAREADGQPAGEVEIWLLPARSPGPHFFVAYQAWGQRTTKSDARGEFEFKDIPTGQWYVGPGDVRNPTRPWLDSLAAPWAQHVDVAPDVTEIRADLQLTRNLTIRGRVEDVDGHPSPYARVWGLHVESGAITRSECEEDGTFVFGPLVVGNYRLHAEFFSRQNDRTSSSSLDVSVPSGARDVVLRLQQGGVLAGRVVDSITGDPLAADMVLALEPGQAGLHLHDTWGRPTWNGCTLLGCDLKYGFQTEHLPPATYSLAARTTTGRAGVLRKITLAPGELRTDLVVRVAPSASVSVRYEGPHPSGTISILCDGVAVATDAIEKGTLRSFCVPAGHSIARMTFDPASPSFDANMDLTAGAKKELVFDRAWK